MKTTINFLSLAGIFIILFFIACDKEDNSLELYEATVLFMAPPDNCNAYVIHTDEHNFFKPSNLSEEFEIDSLQIQVAFDTTENFHHCGFGGSIPVVDIIKIKKY